MKKYLAFAMFLVLAVALTSPFSVSAKTKAGAKSGSFFYFFDKAIEKTSLFFIFNPEKKAKKTLEYAEERLAEAEELKKEKEEKEIPEIKKGETEEVKTSEKDIEKTDNKLKKEENKQTEIKNDKKEAIKNDEQIKKIEKLKKEVEGLKQKTSQIKIVEKVEKPVAVENKQSSSSQASNQTKQKEVTLPNGAVVEMDTNGNIIRTIKEAPRQTYTAPAPTAQSQNQTIPLTVSPSPTTQPELTPAPSCTQDTWNCSDWLECSTSSSQTRTCNKTFECPLVVTPSPSTSQSCTPPAPSCQADTWSCSDWSSCSTSGNQTRSCTKTFDCSSVATPTPSTSQSCTPPTQTPTPTYQQTNGPRFVSWADSIGNTLNNNFDYYGRGAWEQHTVMSTPISISEHPTLTIIATASDPNGRPLQYRFESSVGGGYQSYSSNNSFTFNVSGTPGTIFRAVVDIKNDDTYLSYSSGILDIDAEWFVDYPLIP